MKCFLYTSIITRTKINNLKTSNYLIVNTTDATWLYVLYILWQTFFIVLFYSCMHVVLYLILFHKAARCACKTYKCTYQNSRRTSLFSKPLPCMHTYYIQLPEVNSTSKAEVYTNESILDNIVSVTWLVVLWTHLFTSSPCLSLHNTIFFYNYVYII